MYWVLLLLVASREVRAEEEEDKRAECIMWSHLENQTMPLQDQGHATCTTNDQCSGFSCHGEFKENPVTFGMRVLYCQEPPGLELFGHAPQFNAQNFSHVFKHGSRYEIPGVFLNQQALDLEGAPRLPMMPSDVPGLNLYFVVTMEPVPGKETLNCGLEIQACVNTSVVQNDLVKKLHGEEMCIIKKPIFNNTEIPVPRCQSENKYPAKVLVGEVCNVNEVGQCGEHMTCVQASEESEMGKCECLSSYRQQADRTCVENLPLAGPQPSVQEASGGAQVGVAVICLLILVVVSVLGVILVRRYRLLPRFKARLTNTPYEDIVISEGKPSTKPSPA